MTEQRPRGRRKKLEPAVPEGEIEAVADEDALRARVLELVGNRQVERHRAENVTPEILAKRLDLVKRWADHPWLWLTGKDLNDAPIIYTKDEGSDNPVKPWPNKDYLREYVSLLFEGRTTDPMLFVDKARQMMVTWATILYADWECRFRYARRWLLSKSTEEEAKEILKDKPRFVHRRLPPWVQDILPMGRLGKPGSFDKPAGRVDYPLTESYILAVAENAADRETRGGTASGVIVDECARQFGFREIVGASIPMATRIVAMTTAELGNPGAEYCLEIKASAEKRGETVKQAVGWLHRRVPGTGWSVLELDAEADPLKRDAEWHNAMESKLGTRRYRREIKRDWTLGSGEPYYPEFSMRPELYTLEVVELPAEPVVRGWDFGYRFPACIWSMPSPRRNRLMVLREFMPQDVPADTFGTLVLWLSGQLDEAAITDPMALSWVARLKADDDFPPVPFFEANPSQPIRFLDYSGPECLTERAEVSSRTKERSTAKILEKMGIHLQVWSGGLDDRELILRKLLKVQRDGRPGLLVSPWCKLLIRGLRGGITFARPSKLNPIPDKRAKDGFYDNLDDALGYPLPNLFPLEGELPEPELSVPRLVREARDVFSRRVPIGTEDGGDALTLPRVG